MLGRIRFLKRNAGEWNERGALRARLSFFNYWAIPMNVTTKLRFFALALCFLLIPSELIAAPSLPKAALDATVQDFGRVKSDSNVRQTFVLRNEGSAELEVQRVEVSMPGMRVRVRQKIPPQASAEINVEWDVRKLSGQTEGHALLHLNDPSRPEIDLTLKGEIVQPIEIKPYPAIYMSAFQGEEAARSVTIVNTQERLVTINKLEQNGDHFVANLETVQAGKNYELIARIAPDAPVGRYRESVVLHTDDPAHPRLRVEVNTLVKADVFVNQEDVDFGQLSLTQLKQDKNILPLVQQSLIVTRRTGRLAITAIESDIPFIAVAQDPPGKAGTFRLDIGLDLGKVFPGKFQGNVRIRTDDPKFPVLSIPISGELIR